MIVSYAQNAEDVVLGRAFPGPTGFYVDVGAFHPVEESVTKMFYDRGWSGINIEPHPGRIEIFALMRPRDVNVPVAVSKAGGSGLLHVAPAHIGGHSTLEGEVRERHGSEQHGFSEVPVTLSTLAAVLEEHLPAGRQIDFLKIDVEGHEASVLEGNDWERFRPRAVVVEAIDPAEQSPNHASWEPILPDVGYSFVLFDGINRFYARSDCPDLAAKLAAPASALDQFEPVGTVNLRRELRLVEEISGRRAQQILGLEHENQRLRGLLEASGGANAAQAGGVPVLAAAGDDVAVARSLRLYYEVAAEVDEQGAQPDAGAVALIVALRLLHPSNRQLDDARRGHDIVRSASAGQDLADAMLGLGVTSSSLREARALSLQIEEAVAQDSRWAAMHRRLDSIAGRQDHVEQIAWRLERLEMLIQHGQL
jgi:FkbM family methyltransferase